MLRISNVKRILSVFLVISLICSNFSPMILGLVSFALEENESENTEETISPLEIETVEFSKNNMQEEETEYGEKVKLNLNYEEPFKEVVISDVSTKITDGVIQEETELEEIEQEETNIFYKTTKINKEELISIIGKTGTLEIEYEELVEEESEEHSQIIDVPEHEEEELPEEEEVVEEETSNESEEEILEEIEVELEEIIEEEPKGIITAEDGIVTLTSETEADEDGNITIVYPERTKSINIKISTEINKIENFTIVNTRRVEKVEDLDKVAELETVKDIIVKTEKKEKKETIEVELLNAEVTTKMPISYSKTLAELGLDKTQISTSIENKVTLTVTLNTEKAIYDLYKTPYFVIELPSEIKTLNIDKAVIINNEVFEPEEIEQGVLANGNNAIAIKLNGEQLEHTKSAEANIQIVLELTIKTEELIPTLDREVTLHYTNENANTYNGVELEAEGTSIVPIELVSNSEVIVETRATVGDTTTIALRDNSKEINIEPNTFNRVIIEGTAINNTGANIKNARILVSATNISEISGVEKVYYTENENATAELNNAENLWTANYTSNVNKALIVIPEYEQGQTVRFGYEMNLPENPEMELQHIAQFEVYDNNNQKIKTSKITVNQEAEKSDEIINEEITARLTLDKTELEMGDIVKLDLDIQNNTVNNIENMTAKIKIPKELEIQPTTIIGKDDSQLWCSNNTIHIRNLNVEAGENVQYVCFLKVIDVGTAKEAINARVMYGQEKIDITRNIRFNEISKIEAEITSEQQGKTLEKGDIVKYNVILKNNGNSHAEVTVKLSELSSMRITEMSRSNINTNETSSIANGNLKGMLNGVEINPGETVEVTMTAIIEDVDKDKVETVYAEITGEKIKAVTTNSLSIKLAKTEEKLEQNIEENNEFNSISGIAWIDKNANGRKDENEVLLKGVLASLINTETGETVATQITNKNGEYIFDNLPKGKYVVEFNYNTTSLAITDYKTSKVEESLDSDIINTTQNDKTTTKTEIISLKNGKEESVNAGFVINKKFDLSVNKGIIKITTDNENGTNTYEFNSESTAEVKADNKFLTNSLLLVEYEIAVTNSGEIAGYAKLISDKIPEGMTFNSELNTNWYEGNDGKIYSVALADSELQPGETKVIKLVLTKEITNENMLEAVSTATIEKAFNDYLIKDGKQENDSSETTIVITNTGRRK